VIAFIVFIERAQRQLLIQYPKRQVGSRMFQGDTRTCRSSSTPPA
jgi:preprotein translocase subunit SecY